MRVPNCRKGLSHFIVRFEERKDVILFCYHFTAIYRYPYKKFMLALKYITVYFVHFEISKILCLLRVCTFRLHRHRTLPSSMYVTLHVILSVSMHRPEYLHVQQIISYIHW